MTTNADLAAAAISYARTASGRTNPEFDYDISIHGIGGPLAPIGQAVYVIATRSLPADATPEAREAAWRQLLNDLQPELRAYEQRCRERKYSGWSAAAQSRGDHIRYAS